MNTTLDSTLAERHRSEAQFHDRKYVSDDAFPRHYRHSPTVPVLERMLALLPADLSGLRVLEYGCGNGWITLQLARRGAQVSAFDISPEAVAQTRTALGRAGLLDRCKVDVMPGEQLAYADASVDIAVGFAILHHLDMDRALAELHRVLAPGGRAFFAEPLAGNPLIRLYRALTPQYRTPDEAPIDLPRFGARVAGFSRYAHRDQLLLAAGALALAYLPRCGRAVAPVQRALTRVDDVVLRVAPGAGRWAWYSVLELDR
jgi:SAM-dependent methyltransferase